MGGILNLGESPEQRVEMAFQLAALDPTSVPINLLNPRPGTKFGDRELMDPWEAVKWIAIFRLVFPDALFRLCGGRVENLGDLQPLAIKAGVNGVMMGNFLTTLGNTPEQDRDMFEALGLNVARQPDNGANPRPDNRSGWLAGDAPVGASDVDLRPGRNPALNVRLWDPATQLRFAPKRAVPQRPDGSPNTGQGRDTREALARARRRRRTGELTAPRARSGEWDMIEIEARLQELTDMGMRRRTRLVSGPPGTPRRHRRQAGSPALLQQLPRAGRPSTHAPDHKRRGDALGRRRREASRLVSGTMTVHRRLEDRLAAFTGRESALLFGSGYLANAGVVAALARPGRCGVLRRAQSRFPDRRVPALARRGVRL